MSDIGPEEAIPGTPIGVNQNAGTPPLVESLLAERYLLKDKNGKIIETVEQMFRRVAHTIAKVEAKYGASDAEIKALANRFYALMTERRFLPNSPTLMNVGREGGMLSACFVQDVEDSIDGIFEAVKNTAIIQKTGGGTGFSFDKLRPAGDVVRSSGGATSGPLSFMKVFSETTNAIQQGASRRGANMGMMSIEHPDILKFIHAKQDLNALTNFNISVKITASFMEKLQNRPESPHIVTNPRTGKRYVMPRSIDVRSYGINDLLPADEEVLDDSYTVKEIWDMIIRNAHATGEPGVCFIDRVNEDNPTPNVGQMEATNPCGEQPLLPGEACNLGSINVAEFVNQDRTDLDWDALAEAVELAVRFLDDVIDANHFPLPAIRERTLCNRKIGLGIMGFADALILLYIKYDSKEAVAFAHKLAAFIQEHAHDTSERLARERGSFPNWAGSIWDTKHHRPMRAAGCTTIAPTGSISLIAGCNGGIEPIFKIVSKRKILDDREFVQLHPVVESLGTEEGWLSDEVRSQLHEGVASEDIPEIPKKTAEVLVTAHDIDPEWHIRIQGAFQEHVDNAVSKTVNLPSSATAGDVDRAYRLAYQHHCKGVTIYRDDCHPEQVIKAVSDSRGSQEQIHGLRDRVKTTTGATTKFRMGCGTLFVTANKDENGLCEVFANLGKAGCPSQSEAMCRAISVALRCGVDPRVLIEQLKGIRCLSTIAQRKTNKDIDVLSCPDAIARAIEHALGEHREPVEISPINRCPDCSYPLRRESGCNVCDNCGYSKCG